MRLFSKVFLLTGVVFFCSFLAFYSSTGSYLEKQMGIQVIMEDFLVSDESPPYDQDFHAIARDASGNFVITWRDYRGVDPGAGIYAQRYNSSGTPLNSNFKVSEDGIVYGHTDIAMDGNGNFVITWADDRITWPIRDIYAQRYTSSGIPLGSNFMVCGAADNQGTPAIAMNAIGDFVIAWNDCRNNPTFTDIYAQRFNSSGTPQGSDFKVNDDLDSVHRANLDIAIDANGNFVITWQDDRNAFFKYDVYAQLYSSWGTPQGSNFKVNDDTDTSYDQRSPAIAMYENGNFVITWDDNRNGSIDIYAQRYNSSGTPLGSNFRVDDATSHTQREPAIGMDGSGNFIITWTDLREPGYGAYAQLYDSSGTPLGSNFRLNNDRELLLPWTTMDYLDVALDQSGNFVVAWTDRYCNFDGYNYHDDVFLQRYTSTGTPLDSNFKVNDDKGDFFQFNPAIAMDVNGNSVITWEDYRHGLYREWDIVAQSYNSSGTPLGGNFRVIDIFNPGTRDELNPAIAMNAGGNFIITWEDYYSPTNWDIWAQRYDSSGVALDYNFKVNDDVDTAWQINSSVAMDANGSFVIIWEDYRDSEWGDIGAQRYDSSGTPLGFNFIVNDGALNQTDPAIAMDANGNFVITWEDRRNLSWDIYAQRYSSSGTPLGSNFMVSDYGSVSSYPAVAMDANGYFVITWADTRNPNLDIYAQRYDSSGTPLGSSFRVNDDYLLTVFQGYPSIDMDESGNFVITWEDYRNGNPDIYAQRYSSSGTTIGENYLVPEPLNSISFDQKKPAVAVNNSIICFTWEDDRRGNDDIYAKIVDWGWAPEFAYDTLSYTGYSPIDLIVTDPAGDSIGVDFNTIPGALYDTTTDVNDDGDKDDRVIIPEPLLGEYLVRVIEEPGSGGGTYTLSVQLDGNDETPMVLNGTAPGPGEEDSVYYAIIGYLRGDPNTDGSKSVSDAVFLINYLFKGGEAPVPSYLGDVNCDESVSVSDVVYLINYLFKGGAAPCS